MRLWKSPSEYIHSYRDTINIDNYAKTAYQRNWVIEMPSQVDNGIRELFVTIKALSVAKAECMEGRATVVWVVRKITASGGVSDEIYVLKQAWRPAEKKHEGEIYPPHEEAQAHHIGRVYSYEDVDMGPRIKVGTKDFIRGNLEYKAPPSHEELNTNQKRAADNLDDAEKNEPFITVISTSDQFMFNFKTGTVVDRVLARTLLVNSFGWPLHQFCDLPELIRVTKHAVDALGHLAYERGTLQRDISTGNVLIFSPGGPKSTEGCIIDFDCAKTTDKRWPALVRRQSSSANAGWAEEHESNFRILQFVLDVKGKVISESLLRAMTLAAPASNAMAYLDHLEDLPSVLTAENLGLFDENFTGLIPDFTNYMAKKGARSATLPFASSEVLLSERIFTSGSKPAVAHNLIHDLEALFWCLVYICVTREGPGGRRREELRPDYKVPVGDQANNIALRNINYCFFAANDIHILARNKSSLFMNNDFVDCIVPRFHPYFEPLKPLMVRWWNILRTALQFPTLFEAPLLAIDVELGKAYRELEILIPSAEDRRKSADVTKSRNKELAELRAWPPGVQPGGPASFDLSPSNHAAPESLTHYKDGPSSPTPAPRTTHKEVPAFKKAKADSSANLRKKATGKCKSNQLVCLILGLNPLFP
ncbi:hypothetical protein DXG01_015649 [Tephrocybe rancida]|nr:hypothetical protein DXG01_015649 [Tephrocybe rancida]